MKRPALADLLTRKGGTEPAPEPAADVAAAAPGPRRAKLERRMQMSLRLPPETWEALKMLAIRERTTAHAIAVEGVHHMLALHGVKTARQQDS